VNQKSSDLFIVFIHVILLGLAFDEIAIKGSFENWRIMACEVFVNNNRLRLRLATSVNGD
jgi:hypothetical protein